MEENPTFLANWTGGPCSGKTTGLTIASQILTDKGVKVAIRDEIATRFILGGITPWDADLGNEKFQRNLILATIESDNRLRAIMNAMKGEKKLIMFDRGLFDSRAYIDDASFTSILKQEGLQFGELMGLTDMVVCMQTAAYGAEQFYTLANNAARKESIEEARLLDDAVKNAWIGHEHLRVVTNDNGKSFEDKIREATQLMFDLLGMPVPIESERVFLVEPDSTIPVEHCVVDISQTYLYSVGDAEERVRRRTLGGGSTFYYTKKEAIIGSADRIETSKRIDERTYYSLIEQRRDPAYVPVNKRRNCFLWKNQYFELDTFVSPCPGESQMEWEATDRNHLLEMPPFVKVIREVTGEKAFSNRSRARLQTA